MPFPMIHFYVAKNIADYFPQQIQNSSQYYLGVIGPDSVHFGPDFKLNDKNISHLTSGNEKWGETTETAKWLDNVLAFLRRYENTEGWDFAFGYTAHILADIYNCIYVWTPYRLAIKLKMDNYYGNQYHREQAAIDLRLAHEFQHKDEIWALLENAKILAIPGVVDYGALENIVKNVLYNQYADMDSETEANQIFTYKDAHDLISNATRFSIDIMEQRTAENQNAAKDL
jgi:hypothetical protein